VPCYYLPVDFDLQLAPDAYRTLEWQPLLGGVHMAQEEKQTSMHVSVPTSIKAFVDERVAAGGFGSVSDYVRALIREDQREQARERLEQKLLEALESKESPMTPEDWISLRAQLTQRHRGRDAG
jgi:antitoxin ParD1/3/4